MFQLGERFRRIHSAAIKLWSWRILSSMAHSLPWSTAETWPCAGEFGGSSRRAAGGQKAAVFLDWKRQVFFFLGGGSEGSGLVGTFFRLWNSCHSCSQPLWEGPSFFLAWAIRLVSLLKLQLEVLFLVGYDTVIVHSQQSLYTYQKTGKSANSHLVWCTFAYTS